MFTIYDLSFQLKKSGEKQMKPKVSRKGPPWWHSG